MTTHLPVGKSKYMTTHLPVGKSKYVHGSEIRQYAEQHVFFLTVLEVAKHRTLSDGLVQNRHHHFA